MPSIQMVHFKSWRPSLGALIWWFDPATNSGMENGSSVGMYALFIHVFARLVPICMLSRCLLTKFLHRSSVGSLLRVRCWLGKFTVLHCTMDVAVERKNKNPLQKHFLSLLLSLSSLVDLFSPFPDSISNCLFFCRLRRLRYLWRAVTGIQFQPFLFFFFFSFVPLKLFWKIQASGRAGSWGGVGREREGQWPNGCRNRFITGYKHPNYHVCVLYILWNLTTYICFPDWSKKKKSI